MLCRAVLAFCVVIAGRWLPAGEAVRLKATADVWLSDAIPQERNSSSGKCSRLKLKTIQEMAAIRFDASRAKGREVLKATLYLRRAGRDQLRYIRVSTVSGHWVEGSGTRPYGPPDGATYLYADGKTKRPWSWPGSQFCDVIMGSGNSIATWAECKKLPNGWIAVPLTPDLIYAMVCRDTDGLAIMDGGSLSYFNNYIHSVQSRGSEPYIEVVLGKRLSLPPAKPLVVATRARSPQANIHVLRLSIASAPRVFCWQIELDGKPVQRWRVPHPNPDRPTVFLLEAEARPKHTWRVVAVARGGVASRPASDRTVGWPDVVPAPAIAKLRRPRGSHRPPERAGKLRVWALPPLVKISPESGKAMFRDASDDIRAANAVWDGRAIKLFGARGETVSFQLCIERLGKEPLAGIRLTAKPLANRRGRTIGSRNVEFFRNWYARNKDGKWQPAYCVPLPHDAELTIPDPMRKLPRQQNQTVYVEIHASKDAEPSRFEGAITVEARDVEPIRIPVQLTLYDFLLPDRLSFWPELNAYRIPKNAHAYWRLAHEHRCVANYWRWQPQLRGSGKNIRVVWERYDRDVGPLLTGEAFKDCKRAGAPVEVMYLPFEDSWPTPLTKGTYNYQGYWPKRGDDKKWIVEHYLKAPYIGDALSRDYKDAFLAVQRQFIEHFRQKGYARTEMQCFYGGKNTHRIRYGSNMWWTTDEPYHWDDWLALQFFCRLWTQGRGDADRRFWVARADISRPQWQGQVLDGIANTVYYGAGAFSSPPTYRRCRTLARRAPLDLRTYGSANKDNESNTRSVVWCLNAWLNGANAVLPWQTLGSEKALDVNDRGAGGGNALIVPGGRFAVAVVADMRLKALRDGQQLVEYLAELGKRWKLSREQLKVIVHRAVRFEAGTRAGTGPDNADALQFSTLKAWQITELRRAVAELIVKKRNEQ